MPTLKTALALLLLAAPATAQTAFPTTGQINGRPSTTLPSSSGVFVTGTPKLKCDDGWQLVMTQANAALCARELKLPRID